MAGGIDISTDAAASLAGGAALAIVSVSTGQASNLSGVLANAGIAVPGLGAYRPYTQNKPATYSIVVPAQSQVSQSTTNGQTVGSSITDADSGGNATIVGPGATGQFSGSSMYVFDAVFVANHDWKLRKTKDPLQSGYNITYHAVLEEPTLVLEIGMSDAMTAYASGMWTGNPSKSISAFQQMITFVKNRTLMTISTRQMTYTNMMLIGIQSPETNKTVGSMRATLIFEQTFLVSVASQTISARPNATDSTQQASVQPTNVPATITQQNQITPAQLPVANSNSELNSLGIPSGGDYSSNNLGIPGLPNFTN